MKKEWLRKEGNKNVGGEKKKMKTKNSSFGKAFLSKKRFALVGIAVVLCSLFLVALPVISADQNQTPQKASVSAGIVTTASEDDYVLGIYGNANEDDTIDMRDVTYTKLVIFGKKPETELADAYYDDEVDVLDVVQIKLIILGRESELTLIDSADRIVTVSIPVERIIALTQYTAEGIRALGAKDRIVGIDEWTTTKTTFFPDISKKPSVGSWYAGPDIEQILTLEADTVFTYILYPSPEYLEDKLPPGISVIRFDFLRPPTLVEEMNKLGYILGETENAREYLEWHDKCTGEIEEIVSGIPEAEKPKVFLSWMGSTTATSCTTFSGWWTICEEAGGINIAADFEEYWPVVELEWVIDQNPEVIVGLSAAGNYGTDDESGMEAEYTGEIMELPGFDHVTAVKTNRVHILSFDVIDGQEQPVGLSYMAKWFHPELFEDLDPRAIHQEFIDNFCPGLDYDVYEQSVFVYPPLE